MLDDLKQIIPVSQILSTKKDLLAYTKDYSYAPRIFPRAVVLAEKNEDVEQVLKWANKNKVPVALRGAGTGKSGGCIPNKEGIVLSMERMNKIIDIDTKNKMVITQAGAILKKVQEKCLVKYLYLPLDPSSLDQCTIGGMVNENAGGAKSLKYGVTGDYVCGLKGYLGSGEPFQFGGKLYKDVAGYDLKKLLVGSEGTLSVVTEITLKCIAPVKEEISIWMTFSSIKEGVQFVQDNARSENQVAAAEFMQKECIKAVEKKKNIKIEHSEENAHVLIMLDGHDKESLINQANLIMSKLPKYSKVIIAKEAVLQAYLWGVRRDISESLSFISQDKVSEDITVPPDAISDFMERLSSLDKESKYSLLGYGHLGDGNIHVNILNMTEEKSRWEKDKIELLNKMMTYCLELGGTPSGEHGIGLTKKEALLDYFKEHEITLMKNIKSLFDPNHILNPDKVF